MDRMNWFSLICCILSCLMFSSDATTNMFSACKKIASASHEEELDCRNLNYKFIPPEIFDISNKRIYLSKNPYICNCGILWFLNALHEKSLIVKIVDLHEMTCTKPEHLKEKLVQNMKKSDVCGKVIPCHDLSCSKYAKCIQDDATDGDKCVCRTGYKGNGTSCQDLDECKLGNHSCSIYQECQNTLGSFECRCKSGLKVNSKGHCDVLEPCEILFRPCNSSSEVCVNKQRAYECACKRGFQRKSGTNVCTDENECEQTNICSKQAWCLNKIGSYRCICNKGYTRNGKVCEDVDECATKEHNCPDETVCVNSVGGYKCVCKPGYNVREVGDGTAVCEKNEEKKLLENEFILYGGAGVIVLLIFTICCCCYCCCRRKSKKQKQESEAALIGDKAMQANQDLFNMAMETDPFLLQQQQVEQQMYMLGMQQQPEYMTYFDEAVMSAKGVRPNDSALTTWSDDDDTDDVYAQYYDETY